MPGSGVRVVVEKVKGKRCFRCGRIINGEAIHVISEKLYYDREKDKYVWRPDMHLYYHPRCYGRYISTGNPKSILSYLKPKKK